VATTLTIGMAHHSDFDGVYFTTEAIRLYHRDVLDRVELLVVDNSPGGESGKMLQALVEQRMRSYMPSTRYIPMTDRGGTSQTRNRIFSDAKSDAVLCMDCHVLLAPGSLQRLLDYYDAHPESQDLLTGPLLTDQGDTAWTHFNNVWRGHMWGVWGVARTCTRCGDVFSPVQLGDMVEYRSLAGDGSQCLTTCQCGLLPSIPWVAHEPQLEGAGYVRLGLDVDAEEPFEIPAQGLGLFTCRKDAWLGFNPHFRGFGGEECYIHEKYRQAGRRNLCLPALKWLHRFSRPNGPRYPLRTEDRVRNYVLGHQELGLDPTPVHDHFVSNGITEDTWRAILADPEGYGQNGRHQGGGCNSCKKEIEALDVDQTFEYYASKQSDFNEHFLKLQELAAQCEHVTECGSRDYGVIPLLAGKPKILRSYNSQLDGAAFWKAEQLGEKNGIKVSICHDSFDAVEIEETDLLFYDPAKSDLFADLERHHTKIRRFIVVHDTDIYGVKLPDGRPGLKLHLMRFMKAYPEWTVVYSTTTQYGLMVLSRNPEDKPKRPSIFKMAPTFIGHMTEYVMDGAVNVSPEHLGERLKECTLCDLRTANSQCSLCGCPILDKAKMRAMRCDANKWAEVDAKFQQDGAPESQ